jgi:FixJ family two-component response regulator
MPVISIVDDDVSMGEAIGGLMKALGFNAEVFTSAEAFLESGRAVVTACVIADVQMPGMSGIDLEACLVREGYEIPFVFITAFPNERVRDQALQSGAVCFLAKPFSEAELVAGIRSALSLPKP